MLALVLKVALILFLVGNLAGVGLELTVRDALAALRNVRFALLAVVRSFVLCPAFAYLISKGIPLERPYVIGLLLFGMAPCAPFLPMVVKKTRGDLSYVAALMLLTAIGTVGFMPLAVPMMIPGMSASARVIAKPLVLFVLAPLIGGVAIRQGAEQLSRRMCPIVKKTTDVATVVMLVVVLVIYGKGFISMVGSYAIGAQVLFLGAMGLGAYWLGFGLKEQQKIVLSMGMCTRNVGAAFAPLLEINIDPRAILMVAMAVPVTVLLSLAMARWFSGQARRRAAVLGSVSQRSTMASSRTAGRP